MEASVDEHRRIVQTIHDQDPTAAADAAMSHIRAAKNTRLKMLSIGE